MRDEPKDIAEFTVQRKCRGATYKIRVKNSGGTAPKLSVNGKAVSGELVPYAPAGSTVEVLCEI